MRLNLLGRLFECLFVAVFCFGDIFYSHNFGLIQLVLACLRRYGLSVECRKLANCLKYCELNLIRSLLPYKDVRMSYSKKESENSKRSVPQFHKLMEMPVTARLVLGECRMDIEEILKLGQGSMLELSTMVNEDLKLYINDAEIAKAKSVMVGEKLGAQIKEISSTEDRLKDLTDLEKRP